MADSETPRDYDREYQRNLPGPLQVRVGRDTEHGSVSRFLVQLEYYYLDDGWQTVVRYDHDPDSEFGHDVADEGLHMDIYRDGEKYRTEFISPPMEPAVALDHAEDHLAQNLQRYVERFEEWHGIRSR
ncbi:MAG: hypothetical protein ABEI98_03875 [Halorhabdus sp.]